MSNAKNSQSANQSNRADGAGMTVRKDRRFRVVLEFCGHSAPQFVARFCGEWVGASAFAGEAWRLAEEFNALRLQ